jgi:hypothetical protein
MPSRTQHRTPVGVRQSRMLYSGMDSQRDRCVPGVPAHDCEAEAAANRLPGGMTRRQKAHLTD